jgi:ElaB/YqjD/DUF883 family membrane-anchored ribosome-binding protein
MAENDLKKEMEQLRTDLAALRADVAELAKVMKDIGVDKAESVKSSVEDDVRKYRDALYDKLNEAKARGYDAKDKVDEQIASHPYGSLLTAFGVGFIFAKLMHLGERH